MSFLRQSSTRSGKLLSVLKQGRHGDGYLHWIVNEFPESDSWWNAAASTVNQSANLNVGDLLSELKNCTTKRDLLKGRGLHTNAVKAGISSNMNVAVALINLYTKCGSMEEARTLFNSIQEPNVVCWTVLIQGYAEYGQGSVALDLFSKMKEEGRCAPNSVTYLAALKACTLLAADEEEAGKRECLQRGRQIHSEIGCHMNQFLQSRLINLYGTCGSMEDARTVFDSIQEPNVVCWTILIQGYTDNGQASVALDLFFRMKDEGKCAADSLICCAALKACMLLAADGGEAGKRECLQRARQIHSEIGCHMNENAQSTFINLYAKCGSMEDARKVFDSIQDPDTVSWNTLILGYAENGQDSAAIDLFSRMKEEGKCAPDSFTYLAALKACTLLAADGGEAGKRTCLQKGRQIHSEIDCHMNHFVQSTLINLYGTCGSMNDARIVFDSIQNPNVVCWTVLILGYAENGQGFVALDLFSRMKEEGKCAPSSVTYLAALKACTLLAADGGEAGRRECLQRGRQIHSEIGCHMNRSAQSMLINMYAKCGNMLDARSVFDNVQEPDVVCWNALILGYADNGQGLVALDLFSRVKDEGRCTPNSVTYLAALKACCSVGALAIGRRIHSVIREFDYHVVTCLVDFYAKCGNMEEAHEVFNLHPQARDVSTWTALLAGYAQFGDTGSSFRLFEAMQDQGCQPDAITFVCMLSCCSHAGLVEKAWHYLLEVMPLHHKLTPTVMHYNCMVDLLGRANKLDEAIALLQKMPCDPNAVTWTALLGACRKWKNVEIGRWAFKSLLDLDQNKARAYSLMAEIYGSRDMWEEQEKVLEARMKFGCKLPAQAYVMDGFGRMAKFVLGEENNDESYSLMQEKALCGHSERRAVFYGILNTPAPGDVIRVVKNTRTCDDCHSAIKMISKITERVIMIRDEITFHVMKNGNCSCKDYF